MSQLQGLALLSLCEAGTLAVIHVQWQAKDDCAHPMLGTLVDMQPIEIALQALR